MNYAVWADVFNTHTMPPFSRVVRGVGMSRMSSVTEESAAAMEPNTPQPPWPNAGYAWYVMVVLIIAYTFAIVDRSIISLLVQPIKADLGVTDAQIGLLQGLAFAICYTTFGLALGFVTDRTNRALLLALSIFVWSAATIACGFAKDFQWLFISRIFVGLGEAGVLPVAGSLIADYLPPARRAKAYGVFLLGGTGGTMFGSLIGGHAVALSDIVRSFSPAFVDTLHDWQIVFLIVGVPGLAVSALFALSVREPERREKTQAGGMTLAPLIAHLRINWVAYTTLLASCSLNVLCIYAQITWAATFILRVYKWTPEEVGNFLVLPSIVGATSAFTVGWMMARWIAKGRQDAPMIAALVHGFVSMIIGPLVYSAPSSNLMIPAYLLMATTSNWSTSAALMGVSHITPNQLRGQLTAFYTLLSGLISLSAGTYAVGVLSDNVYTGPTGLRWSLVTVYILAGGLSVLLVTLGRPAYRAAAQRALAWSESR